MTGIDWLALLWLIPVALLIPAFVRDHKEFCK